MAKTGKKRTDESDRELIEMALKGEQKAFTQLLSKYRDALTQHILGYVRVCEDAEDICQRSFEKAFMNIDKYNSQFAFSTWLYNIAQNESIDHLRKKKGTISAISINNDTEEALNILAGLTPEEKVIIDQGVGELVKRIYELPENYRTIAELRFIKDYAYEEIASETSLPLGTVKTRLNRARKILASVYSESDNGNDS